MSRRLIDANELRSFIEEYAANHSDNALFCEVMRQFCIIIDNSETIDAVELPCKIGDKVWIARRYKCHKRPRWGIVSEMFFTEDMELCIVVKGVARGKWGVHVFGTCEEAQAAIERRGT